MKHPKNYSRKTKVIGGLLALVVVCFLTVTLLRAWYPSHPKETVATKQNTTAKKQSDTKPKEEKSDTPKQAVEAPLHSSSSPSCQHFTKALADQILKSNSQLNTDSAITSNNGDLEVSFCTYTTKDRAVTLMSYIAKSDVGKSMNSVEFGSGRPAGVQNVVSIGQAAFWNDSLATLSVLKNNNRYSIALTGGTLDQTVDAAKIIIPNV